MPPRFEAWWSDTRSNLWYLPALAVIAGVVLSSAAIWLDDRLDLTAAGIDSPWLFGAGADGARGVLGAIASSLITVVGTVFSVTIVALQLASSQFTPRVLRQFTGDRINQVVLAAFIGTFTYALLVLRSIRDQTDAGPGFVPVIGVTAAIVLALMCVGLLILFIHHMAQQTQVSYILARASEETIGLIDTYFRDEVAVTPDLTRRDHMHGEGQDVLCSRSGYLQHVDADYLLATAREHDLTVRLLAPMGSFVNSRQPIARIWSSIDAADGLEDACEHVRDAFVTGSERTMDGDLPLGIRQIVDIAIKGLSPGINDPTTAVQALDRLSEVLGRAGALQEPERILYVDDRPAVFLPRIGFRELTSIAFTQVRHYGKGDVVVMLHLVRTIERVAAAARPRHHEVLVRHLVLIREAADHGLQIGAEREAVSREVDGAIGRIGEYRSGNRTPIVPDIVDEL